MNVERNLLADVLTKCLAHGRLTRAAISVKQQQPRLRNQTRNQIIEGSVIQIIHISWFTTIVPLERQVGIKQPVNRRSAFPHPPSFSSQDRLGLI